MVINLLSLKFFDKVISFLFTLKGGLGNDNKNNWNSIECYILSYIITNNWISNGIEPQLNRFRYILN